MKQIFKLAFLLLIIATQTGFSQKTKTDANIIGHVVCCEKHLPFATVGVKGTTIGTLSDETGHFHLVNLPAGIHTVYVSMVGYKSTEKTVVLEEGKTVEVKFELEEDVLNIDEVVVSADRSEQKRTEAPVMVNTISPKMFNTSQSVTLGEGLNFSPGLRLENNCQNCGFTQVRMNGMEGPYSQVLINSRPIFSGLAGVYGLELIPANMLEKVEVVRGGGSALYGSNAIAGTINIIMKEPKTNSYEAGMNYSLTGVGTDGDVAPDYTINFNASAVSDDSKSGGSVYGFKRSREIYDANGDEFSEIAPLENLSFGARAYHKFGYRDKLLVDFFGIKEQRDGGSDQSYPLHQRRTGEAVTHNMNVASLKYERYFRDYDMLTLFASGQFLNRDAYYGAGFSTSDYGTSKDNTYNFGLQYKVVFDRSSLVAGIDNTSGFLEDKKLGAPIIKDVLNEDSGEMEPTIIGSEEHTIIADQSSITTGAFAQYDITLHKFKASVGARFDCYVIADHAPGHVGDDKTGNVFSPRVSLMYNILNDLQTRVTYSQGYRAPQIFDEDLHIESSGLHQVIHVNNPDLIQERGNSVMASLDFNKLIGTVYTGVLIEGFYTKLDDAFSTNDVDSVIDGKDFLFRERINTTGASVRGVNFELRLKPLKNFELSSGFTIQNSEFDDAQDWGDTKFLRTPDQYGFVALDWDFYKGFCLSATGNYTGSMLVRYEGEESKSGLYEQTVADGEGIAQVVQLLNSDSFFDMGLKLSYTIKLNGASVQFLGGVKNIFNSYQDNFDSGEERDPAFVYGPVNPRTVYFGIRFGNVL
ncbi:MAG: TonB-dependent receptor [Bacteroidales bacterium]|nr:TonB-dependent receptor [Bacteroidales bacterium]